MVHLTLLKALAVFGGIGSVHGENVFFNDLHLLFIPNRLWVRILTDPDIEGRAFFGMSEYGKGGIMVFGGISAKNFIDGSFHLFRLTPKAVDYLAKYPVEQNNVDYFVNHFGS